MERSVLLLAGSWKAGSVLPQVGCARHHSGCVSPVMGRRDTSPVAPSWGNLVIGSPLLRVMVSVTELVQSCPDTTVNVGLTLAHGCRVVQIKEPSSQTAPLALPGPQH